MGTYTPLDLNALYNAGLDVLGATSSRPLAERTMTLKRPGSTGARRADSLSADFVVPVRPMFCPSRRSVSTLPAI